MPTAEAYMRRALELARNGLGQVSPNPMVGAVIVGPGGEIIGEGWHRRFGGPHAEVNAVAAVADRSLLRDATIYVTLEPCSHYGKTPPCAKLLIDCGIPRVVVGAGDPNPKVAGRGIAMLRQAGIEVEEGLLAEESRRLNATFITAHTLGRPFVTLKWAQSADGFMDSDRPDGRPEQFSDALGKMLVHRLRSLHDAILVGSGTALADRPRLDCRLWPGRSPLPVVLDRRGRLSAADLCTARPALMLDSHSPAEVLSALLRQHGVTSVLVEGGAAVLQSFIDAGLWDVARVETAPRRLGSRGRVPAPRLAADCLRRRGNVEIFARTPLGEAFAHNFL